MFSAIQSPEYTFTYLPSISSPLVPHDVNVCPTLPFLMASTFKDARKAPTKPRSNRYVTVPLKVEEPERRRQVFLKRVKDASDDKRWQTRSDQVRPIEHYTWWLFTRVLHRYFARTSYRSKSNGKLNCRGRLPTFLRPLTSTMAREGFSG